MTPNFQATVTRRHNRAMVLCEQAVTAKRDQNSEEARKLFRKAFEQERQAALLTAPELELEPTRSVLHRSAASLAIECGEFRDAEKLIAVGLSGNPPDEIADELRDLLEQVNLSRHLSLKGMTLQYDEFQLSIAGGAVGYGMAESSEFIDRVQVAEKLLLRTIERKSGRPFREAGKAIKEIAQGAELYLSTPRAASFAVTLRIGLPQKQLGLPAMEQEILSDPESIIDDLFKGLALFESKDEAGLKLHIPDETYRRNFVALAERLGPDGDKVKVVGLTSSRFGQERRVALVKRFVEPRVAKKTKRESINITGTLLFANSTKSEKHVIKIVDVDGIEHTFIVRVGMMADIVRPLYEERVQAIGVKFGNYNRLETIHKVAD